MPLLLFGHGLRHGGVSIPGFRQSHVSVDVVNFNQRTAMAQARFQSAPGRFAFAYFYVRKIKSNGADVVPGGQIGVHFALETELNIADDASEPDGAGSERREGNINCASDITGAVNIPDNNRAGDPRDPDITGHSSDFKMAADFADRNVAADPTDFNARLARKSQAHSLADFGKGVRRFVATNRDDDKHVFD